MEWVKDGDDESLPIKSWCSDIDEGALQQAADLSRHSTLFKHVVLMPDCHQGYGMPIGGVIACDNAIIPNAVGVDIGCGMAAVQTDISTSKVSTADLRKIMSLVKIRVPHGEGKAHQSKQSLEPFEDRFEEYQDRGWFSKKIADLANRNLGTLGGGNHFIEVQSGEDDLIWLMIHSGSRHLGYSIAEYYHKLALDQNRREHVSIPNSDLAFFHTDRDEGKKYIEDMNLALRYAMENRRRIMNALMDSTISIFPKSNFQAPINIHHNYAALEEHFGRQVWVHRKGATSAKKNEQGIIPGSMGTPSYIVKGLGNPISFTSCSHGAGRVMGRNEASRKLSLEDCENAMKGIVYDRWNSIKRGKLKGKQDLGEAPQAYKDIESVINAELDLIQPLVKLHPLAVVKG